MFLCPWNSPCQNTGVGSCFLLQGIFPSPGDLPNPGIEPRSPALQADSSLSEPQGKPKNTGVGSLSLLQQIFPTQELNRGLLHCMRILYNWASPFTLLYFLQDTQTGFCTHCSLDLKALSLKFCLPIIISIIIQVVTPMGPPQGHLPSSLSSRVSQSWYHWHLGLNNSLWRGVALCIIRCSVASLALPTKAPQLWQLQMSYSMSPEAKPPLVETPWSNQSPFNWFLSYYLIFPNFVALITMLFFLFVFITC